MNEKSRARNFSAAAALPPRIAACSAFAAASTDCFSLGARRALGALRFAPAVRGFALAFFRAVLPAAAFARFTTFVDFATAILPKDLSTTVANMVRQRQMFLACFVTPQSGFVAARR